MSYTPASMMQCALRPAPPECAQKILFLCLREPPGARCPDAQTSVLGVLLPVLRSLHDGCRGAGGVLQPLRFCADPIGCEIACLWF